MCAQIWETRTAKVQRFTFPMPEWACPIFTTTGNDGMLA